MAEMNKTESTYSSLTFPNWVFPVWLSLCMLTGWELGVWFAAAASWVILSLWLLLTLVMEFSPKMARPLGSIITAKLQPFSLNAASIIAVLTGVLFIIAGYVALVVANVGVVLCWRAYVHQMARD